jgi:hypothetical protein
MITAAPFTLERWRDVRLQPAQKHEPPSPGYADRLVAEGAAWAYDDAEGHTIAVGGLYPVGPGQAVAWTYLGADCGRYMTALVRAMREAIATHKERWPVVRAAVLADFEAGRRLMAMLGFVPLINAEPIMWAGKTYIVFQKVHYGG